MHTVMKNPLTGLQLFCPITILSNENQSLKAKQHEQCKTICIYFIYFYISCSSS